MNSSALFGVAFGGGRWIVVGASGTVLWSNDGVTWTVVNGPIKDVGLGLLDVEYLPSSSRFIVTAAQGKGWYSDNLGLTWTQVTIHPSIANMWGGVAFGQ
jgi:hypothetical protein